MTKPRDRASLDYTEMPQVNNSPIVESGSNSDGEWTRWADGTQICRVFINNNSDINSWTFPKEFNSSAYRLGGSALNSNSSVHSAKFDSRTTTSVDTLLTFANGSDTGFSTLDYTVFAIGSWK